MAVSEAIWLEEGLDVLPDPSAHALANEVFALHPREHRLVIDGKLGVHGVEGLEVLLRGRAPLGYIRVGACSEGISRLFTV